MMAGPVKPVTVPLTTRFWAVIPPPVWVTFPLTAPVAAEELNRTWRRISVSTPAVGARIWLAAYAMPSWLTSYPFGAVTVIGPIRLLAETV